MLFTFRWVQDVTLHLKCLKEPSASHENHFCTLMCMHLPLFSGNWPQDVLLLMVSLSITADYVHDSVNARGILIHVVSVNCTRSVNAGANLVKIEITSLFKRRPGSCSFRKCSGFFSFKSPFGFSEYTDCNSEKCDKISLKQWKHPLKCGSAPVVCTVYQICAVLVLS